jgi:hypothetical protein
VWRTGHISECEGVTHARARTHTTRMRAEECVMLSRARPCAEMLCTCCASTSMLMCVVDDVCWNHELRKQL